MATLPDKATAFLQSDFSDTGYAARQIEFNDPCEARRGIFGNRVADRHKGPLDGRAIYHDVNYRRFDVKKKCTATGISNIALPHLNAALGESAFPDLFRCSIAGLEKR